VAGKCARTGIPDDVDSNEGPVDSPDTCASSAGRLCRRLELKLRFSRWAGAAPGSAAAVTKWIDAGLSREETRCGLDAVACGDISAWILASGRLRKVDRESGSTQRRYFWRSYASEELFWWILVLRHKYKKRRLPCVWRRLRSRCCDD